MSVLGPTAEILSFASPKESIQRKGDPDAALILRSEAFDGNRQKGLPPPLPMSSIPAAPPPCGLFPPKATVLGGIREENRRYNKKRFICEY